MGWTNDTSTGPSAAGGESVTRRAPCTGRRASRRKRARPPWCSPDADTVAEILDRFRVEVDARVDAVIDNRIDELHAELAEHCTTPGREVRVTTASGSTIEGIARQIDIDGALIVDTGTDRVRVSGADADLI